MSRRRRRLHPIVERNIIISIINSITPMLLTSMLHAALGLPRERRAAGDEAIATDY
jgi:hypothetical protein